ncbi:YbhB/YbcL family Raf kinase inhibitor-like protein [Methylocystis sp. IM3]|uniref:YbhB/YbcL family Raf kinase inhibitor-like protein n=1 Tax=unclassified Methylocystis TaxID=2625913 RepID=UPI000FBB9656|nr:MAG: YbhB/YbcL family Raf kinase inhibitor-like protein [Hyphomicrobiales bacterium]
MKLISDAFSDNGALPPHFTGDGEDMSPALEWSGAPRGTKSFVLLVDDLDAPGGVFHHWACYDIPAYHSTLVEGAGRPEGFEDFRHGVNDFEELGYNGPAPPEGDGLHRYRFRLLALDCAELAIRTHPTCEEVEAEASRHVLAEAELTGLYRRELAGSSPPG